MSLICHLVDRLDILTRMKDGDKDYKSMLSCYYVEKKMRRRSVLNTPHPKAIPNNFFKKLIGVTACNMVEMLYW